MSGTEAAYHLTKEDVKKEQARESKLHGGEVPADSYAAGLQHVVDTADKNKSDIIAERQANLPLPDQPPTASDFNSADARTVNVGSGSISGSFSHGQGQGAGREAADGLSGLPNDAVARGAKDKAGLEDTTGKDYGYPQKNDPANSSK